MIVVTGANGQLGRGVVTALLQLRLSDRIVATVRETAKAAGLREQGVDVHTGDFADPKALETAFSGADQALVISADKLGQEALRLHRNAINAAVAAGVGRVLYTSHMGARVGSPFGPADQHAGTEEDLAASGLRYTALRHGFYAESCLQMIGYGLKAGELRVPEDGPVSWTARADLAEADAIILANSGKLDGVTPPLTASEAVTMADIAAIASEVTGRAITHVVVSDEQWVEDQMSAGKPPILAEMLLGTFRAARRGDFAAVDPTLESLLGRRPTTIGEVLSGFLG